ncbi:MAG TPA: VCBS repeat-containing protein, partial [Urbifossiella sp.]|nr:VCBS repeat-containing protein [Urbifossiella sp.]
LFSLSQNVGTATPAQTATVTVANSILANTLGGSDVVNAQGTGTATLNATGPNIVSTAVVNTDGTVTGTPATVTNPDLGPLTGNGGPTKTLAPNPGSPALDAGSNTAAAALRTDQRGGNFVRVFNGKVDLGAVEAQPGFGAAGAGVGGAAAGLPLTASGRPDGSAVVLPQNPATGQFGTTPATTLNPFGNTGTDVRTAVADVNGDGIPDTILVTGPGTPIRVAVVSGADNTTLLVQPFDPFGGNFTGGGFIAAADLDGDGKAEVVVTPDQGGGPRVSIFSLGTGGAATTRANFLGIDDPNFRGGARAALGDVNGDGTRDVVVAAGFGGGPRVAVFNGPSVLTSAPTRLTADFFAFPGTDAVNLRNGAFVSAGDVDGDGKADLIFGGGPGGAARVFILSGAEVAAGNVAAAYAAPIANFFVAGNANDRGGARVAAENADGDAEADVAVGSGSGDPGRVRVYLGKNFPASGEPATFQDLTPFGGAPLTDGVFVG